MAVAGSRVMNHSQINKATEGNLIICRANMSKVSPNVNKHCKFILLPSTADK